MSPEGRWTPKELAELQNEIEREEREEYGTCDFCRQVHHPNMSCGIPEP